MIGLPTTASSRTWSGSSPAWMASSATRSAIAARTTAGHLDRAAIVEHGERDPAHEVLAEADLRVHDTGRGEHVAPLEVRQVAGDGRRADVDGHAQGAILEARPDRR